MSIYGIGVDLVSIDRLKRLWQEYGHKIAKRFLSESEIECLDKHIDPVKYIAKCFAVKEAVAKAFGTGFSDHVYLKNISYENVENGKPKVCLHHDTKKYASQLNIRHIHLSISHESEFVVAQVVIEY